MKKNPILAEVYDAIRTTILQAGIRGLDEQRLIAAEPSSASFLCAGWSRAWAVEAGLSVGWSFSHEDSGHRPVGRMRFEVSLPTTSRSPAEAVAFATLAREVADLACLLEAQWAKIDVDLKAPVQAQSRSPR